MTTPDERFQKTTYRCCYCEHTVKTETVLDNPYCPMCRRNNAVYRTDYFVKDRFIPKLIGDEILTEYQIVTPKETPEQPHFYDEKAGHYKQAKHHIDQQASARLRHDANAHRLNETRVYIQATAYNTQRLTPPVELLNLKNGIYNINTGELTPHTPDYFFLGALPVALNTSADCPNIKRFLREVTEKEEDALALEEFAGYCLYRALPAHKAFYLLGKGRNGKSTWLQLLTALLGQENITNFSIQTLCAQPFVKVQLLGKLANISADIPAKGITDTGVYKALTGGDQISGQKKFIQEEINFTNYAKLIFACNQLPRNDNDDTDGYYARQVLLKFNKQFTPGDGNCKPKILENELLPELEGFLNLAINGLKRLETNNWVFSNNASIEATRSESLRSSDPLKYFVERCVEETSDPEDLIFQDEFYEQFVNYSKENGLAAPKSKKGTFQRVEELLMRIGKRRIGSKNAWTGLRFSNTSGVFDGNTEQNQENLTPITPITPISLYLSAEFEECKGNIKERDIGAIGVMGVKEPTINDFHLKKSVQVILRRKNGEVNRQELIDTLVGAGQDREAVEAYLKELTTTGRLLEPRAGVLAAMEGFLRE